MQLRHYSYMTNTYRTAEAITIGAAVDLDSDGKLIAASVNEGIALACQAAVVLSSETRDIYSANYDGERNEYLVRTQNVGDPLAIVQAPAKIDNYSHYLGTVAQGDVLYCSGSEGKLCNGTYLDGHGGSSSTATPLARAWSGATEGGEISISVLVG